MKKLLVISFSEVKNDPRVHRQIQLLSKHYDVSVVGFGRRPLDDIEWMQIQTPPRSFIHRLHNNFLLLSRQFEKVLWNKVENTVALQLLQGKKFDLVLANDIYALPLALKVANDSPVLLDAHEYASLEHEDNLLWRLRMQPYVNWLCETYLSHVDAMLTVCEGLANRYQQVFGITPKIVINAPVFQVLDPSEIDGDQIRLIHHGGAIPGRHLETMIDMMHLLDERFTLDFMLVPSNLNYLGKLKKLAAGNKRIRFLKPAPMPEISKTINQYDLGVYILKPNNFNNLHALPNKIFEFIQARLGVAIGPSLEMAKVVNAYKVGVVANDFTPMALANKLNALTRSDIVEFKNNAHAAANELCFEKNADILINEVNRLLGK